MHETDTGWALANPRRTKLGADWKAQPTGMAEHPQPTSPTTANTDSGSHLG